MNSRKSCQWNRSRCPPSQSQKFCLGSFSRGLQNNSNTRPCRTHSWSWSKSLGKRSQTALLFYLLWWLTPRRCPGSARSTFGRVAFSCQRLALSERKRNTPYGYQPKLFSFFETWIRGCPPLQHHFLDSKSLFVVLLSFFLVWYIFRGISNLALWIWFECSPLILWRQTASFSHLFT